MLMSEWLELWLEIYANNSVRKNTLEGYERIVYKHLIPSLGNIPLKELKSIHIRKYLNEKIDNGMTDGGKHHLAILKMSLQQALLDEEIEKNPAKNVKLLNRVKKEYIPWSKEEVEQFLNYTKDTRFYILYLLAWVTGMRRSELMGLRWIDIDFENNLINIRRVLVKVKGGHEIHEPKTKLSKRTITIPKKVTDLLREHQEMQKKESKLEIDYNLTGFVFVSAKGTHYNSDYVSHKFQEDVKNSGLRNVRFCDFRHAHATYLLKIGEDIKVISDRLGHSTIMLTGNTYIHVQHEIQQRLAEKLNNTICL